MAGWRVPSSDPQPPPPSPLSSCGRQPPASSALAWPETTKSKTPEWCGVMLSTPPHTHPHTRTHTHTHLYGIFLLFPSLLQDILSLLQSKLLSLFDMLRVQVVPRHGNSSTTNACTPCACAPALNALSRRDEVMARGHGAVNVWPMADGIGDSCHVQPQASASGRGRRLLASYQPAAMSAHTARLFVRVYYQTERTVLTNRPLTVE